ncbi:hypothetical protein BK133_23470 [Paenibacillus sp. FSL H8-0548]|uniref:DUF4395 domain-containing protein n=1 Tax=Paenibacillus sp. FSL H8-0548 TaxID=1920422 RepID=UPI00096F0A59|nr:DUF4395 domain-containing protein [Paenibacillus sp. FSL H8-0548]OMF23853.1 hypothetical protein BK133_23470 [Paenibacillus sp. FSL H8-0548]
MKEIPIPYVRANQTGIVTVLLIAIVLQLPWLIAALWVIQAAGLLFGPKANLFIRIARPLLTRYIASSQTEAAELQRFNNSLGVGFLTFSLLSFAFGWSIAGYIFAGMMGAAALSAILGYCIGCTLYFQYKQFRARSLNRD